MLAMTRNDVRRAGSAHGRGPKIDSDSRANALDRREAANKVPKRMSGDGGKQLLHLVFGGELKKLGSAEFRDLDALDIVGIYPNYRTAQAAWKAKAQASVDNAHMRYFVVHLHRLLEPETKDSGKT
jgi:hypothetical protein